MFCEAASFDPSCASEPPPPLSALCCGSECVISVRAPMGTGASGNLHCRVACRDTIEPVFPRIFWPSGHIPAQTTNGHLPDWQRWRTRALQMTLHPDLAGRSRRRGGPERDQWTCTLFRAILRLPRRLSPRATLPAGVSPCSTSAHASQMCMTRKRNCLAGWFAISMFSIHP